MTASALFSVASTSVPTPSTAIQPYAVAYGDTVTIQVVNMAGLKPVLSVVGLSMAGQAIPTITNAGNGQFTFVMPSAPTDQMGRAFLVQVVGNNGLDEYGRESNQLTCRRVIGVPNSAGVVPLCGNESGAETDATGLVGWLQRLRGSVGTIQTGTVQLNGATPVDVSCPSIVAGSFVDLMLTTVGGTQGKQPLVTIAAGNKFTVTGTAGDTSTYKYRVS